MAALTAGACAGLLTAAVLAPAPPAVLPLVIAVCIGCPMALAWSLPTALAVIRATRSARADIEGEVPGLDADALTELQLHLDRLPETEHPLGL